MKIQTQIWLGIIVVVVLIISFGFMYFNNINQTNINTIQADGQSEQIYSPDQARVWVGVSILKPNAQDAQEEENRIIRAIVDGLKAKGIAEKDIETENLNLYEEKTWTQSGEKSNGWRATQTLKVKTADFSKVGSIVNVGVSNGANQINNIEFYLSPAKEAEYKKKAIEEATKNARAKAEAMASGAGAKLGKVKSISESNFNYIPYMYGMKNNLGGGAAVSEAATVLPKDVTLTANVNIVYELK